MSDSEQEYESEVSEEEVEEEEASEAEASEAEEEASEAEEEEAASEPEEEEEPEPEPEPEPEEEDDTMEPEEEQNRAEVSSQPRLSMPKISAPRLPEGELVDLDDITRKRREKDLIELQALIAKHFEERKKDEEELQKLHDRIESRKAARIEQAKIRQEKEKQRMAQEREERKKKEEEEEKKREEEEARKKAAIANMSLHYGGYLARAEKNKPNKRQTDREIKKKWLAENKKALNIDHLGIDRLREKAKELWEELYGYEEQKYDSEQRIARQKYDSNQLRQRVNEYMGKFNKNKSKVKIGGRGVAANKFK